MAVALRFQRVGKKKTPYYRLVAVDSRKRRDGRPLEILGNLDPRQDGGAITYNETRFVYWLSCGAEASDRVRTTLQKKGDWAKLWQSAKR